MTEQSTIPDRNIRQRDIAAPEKLANTLAYVVGTGAIGRQVALQLASIGVGHLVLIDFDTVGPENLAVQGFFESDLGATKVEAVGRVCRSLNHEITVSEIPDKFTRATFTKNGSGVVFVCVDKMDARSFIWKTCKDCVPLFVDGRMAAEICRVLTVRSINDHAFYAGTLFSDAEAFPATCTAKTTLYCANVAAGLMVAQLTKMYRGIPYDRDFQFNILANEVKFEAAANQSAPANPAAVA